MTKKILKYSLLVFIAIGIIINLINFFHFRSLWLDESFLALNIVNKSASELLQPLDYNQVAPIGFLLIEKFFSSLFGNTDWSLRIFPMISFFISLYAIYLLSFKIWKNKNIAFFTTALLSLSYYIIYFSTEVKQYIVDVMFGLIILLYTIIITENSDRKKLWLYSLIGVVSIWFSNISIILLFPSGLYYIYKTYKQDKNYCNIVMVICPWIVSFISYYFIFIHNHPAKAKMVAYWSSQKAFLPKEIFSVQFSDALEDKMNNILHFLPSNNLLSTIYLFFIGVGLIYLFIKNRKWGFLLVSPIILHLILAYYRIYPFSERLILYLLPITIMLFVSGVYAILFLLNSKKISFLQLTLVVPLIIITYSLSENIPIEREEIKKSLEFMNKNILENDKIYVYYSTKLPFLYYKSAYSKISKFDEKQIIIGKRRVDNWQKLQEDVKKIKGDVWILFSHVYQRKNKEGVSYEDYAVRTFKENGFKITHRQNYKGSSVYKAVLVSKEKELQQEIIR